MRVQLRITDGSTISCPCRAMPELGHDQTVAVNPTDSALARSGMSSVVLEIVQPRSDSSFVGGDHCVANTLVRCRRKQR